MPAPSPDSAPTGAGRGAAAGNVPQPTGNSQKSTGFGQPPPRIVEARPLPRPAGVPMKPRPALKTARTGTGNYVIAAVAGVSLLGAAGCSAAGTGAGSAAEPATDTATQGQQTQAAEGTAGYTDGTYSADGHYQSP